MDDTDRDMFNISHNARTVAELVEFLRQYPPDWFVRAYEGEGGDWIIVQEEKS